MTVWSLTQESDSGLTTSLFLTQWQAYEQLAREWFQDTGKVAEYAEFMTLIHAGDIEATQEWIEDWASDNDSSVQFNVEEHNHPWTFGPDAN